MSINAMARLNIFLLPFCLLADVVLASDICESDIPGVDRKAIYGTDRRVDWYQMLGLDQRILENASAAVALFTPGSLAATVDGKFHIMSEPLSKREQLCPDEGGDFRNQNVAAFCSGVLIAADKVLTAGHCVKSIGHRSDVPTLKDTAFVFGYRVFGPGDPGPSEIRAVNVFWGADEGAAAHRPLGQYSPTGEDWAIVQLDRPVPEQLARPVAESSWLTGKIGDAASVYVLGYPSGLPVKYAPEAVVRKNVAPGHFTSNLDTFGGNSGSGVYDERTHQLVGVLVRGTTDYGRKAGYSCFKVCLSVLRTVAEERMLRG